MKKLKIELFALKERTEVLLMNHKDNEENRTFLKDQLEEINTMIDQINAGRNIDIKLAKCIEKFNNFIEI